MSTHLSAFVFLLLALLIYVALSVRAILIWRIRILASIADHDVYDAGPGFTVMMLDVRKWTLKQFYPGISI